MYVVEDVSGAEVDKYRYEVNFLPESIVPVTITSNDWEGETVEQILEERKEQDV